MENNPTIEEHLNRRINTPSDINEHLLTLKQYGKECETIVEMGVRTIVSTWAFMAANPKKLISIDFHSPNRFGANLDEVYRLAQENHIDFEFRLENSLDSVIEDCDLLFIDTWHDYLQLKQELVRHHSKVRKYIIFHDTFTFGFDNETFYGNEVTNKFASNLPKGLVPAIQEFCSLNSEWYIHERFANNNGLTILKRIK
jgi:hypothetical protein